ncbi:CYTH and CHAD domain-containing protein [Sinomonas notoginsengisoli]|uniref:CYTH and CHAD domain-containing protein n=1 Tax=Sinomonas notoginsengisoli TaxID=1457311 RepID=UPI001F2D169E|nr:CYTH and CHAD domain-containing protein [Sinomonas notoginsengisoli]
MAGQDALEVGRKYDVDRDAPVPQFTELRDVAQLGPSATHHLEAVYFDTEDLTLAAHGITLRRRTGGVDAGWHLKLPAGAGARTEITEPVGSDTDAVPRRIRQLVAVHVRDRALHPVAELTTRRTTVPLLGADRVVLAEFSDDHVESEAPLDAGLLQSWREWEIELVDGAPELLEAVDALLADAGVTPAHAPSKLARALGPAYPWGREPKPTPKRKGPAGTVLLAYAKKQTDALKRVDPRVRLDELDAVHQLRVAARRMRSVLTTYRKFIDTSTADHLRQELKWMAGTVGQARDVEVTRERLKDMTAAEPSDLLMGPVAQRIEEESGARYRQAHASGLEAMDSVRYFRLLDAIDAFLADPPLTEAGGKNAVKAVARRVAKDTGRLRRAVDAAEAAEDAAEVEQAAVDAALHEVRKSAKRLRYAAEAAASVHGKRAKRLARAAEQIQETLGELQDSVLSRGLLRELAVQAYAEGGNAFSFGRLHALEQTRADEARAQFSSDWTAFHPKSLRRS